MPNLLCDTKHAVRPLPLRRAQSTDGTMARRAAIHAQGAPQGPHSSPLERVTGLEPATLGLGNSLGVTIRGDSKRFSCAFLRLERVWYDRLGV